MKNFALVLLLAGLLSAASFAAEPAKKAPARPDYAKIFPPSSLLQVHITVAEKDWDSLPRKPFAYVPARVQIGRKDFRRVGLRFKGNSSSSVRSQRKSFKLDFDRFEKAQNCYGVKKLNFHNGFKDPTMMREHLAYRLFRAAGVPASRTAFARVYVTIPGLWTLHYLGLYSVVEQVDRTFLRDRFADSSGTLWKGEGPAHLDYLGEDPDAYGNYMPKGNQERGDYAPLIALMRLLARAPDDRIENELPALFDVEGFLKLLAANTLLANLDAYMGAGHNYYLYFEPAKKRITFLPWDLNEAFGNFRMGGSAKDMANMSVFEPYADDRVLVRRILAVKAWRARYTAIVEKLMAGPFSQKAMDAEIKRVKALILKAFEEDQERQYSMEDFHRCIEEDARLSGQRHGEVPGLKSFVRARLSSARSQLAGRTQGVKPRGRGLFHRPSMTYPGCAPAMAADAHAVILVSADGTLTRLDPETLKPSASAALPIPDTAEEKKTGKETGNEILKRLDRDRDGRVSRKEWRGNSRIFDRIDKNSDGFLDRKEFEIMAKGTGRAPGRDPFQKPGREGPGRKGPGRKGPRRGGPQNSAPQEVSLCLTPSFLAVVKGGTLFVYARKTLTLLGHNRFARSVGTEKGRFPNPPRSAPVTIRAQEDTLFLFDGTRVLRINLKKLRVTKEFKLPASSQKPKTDAFETLDRNRDGVIDFDEFQGPPDLFRQADGNRDRVLDRKEVDRLPPDALLGMGRKDARSGKKGQLIVAGKVLLISNGNRVFRLDAKKLKLLSERTLKK